MTRPKKIHSFRMHQEDLETIKGMAEEIGCTQITIVEKALHRYFNDHKSQTHGEIHRLE